MSDAIKHECGIALIRLKKPLSYYKEKYGLAAYIERFKSQCDSPMKQIT